jgi:hypothetical protein
MSHNPPGGPDTGLGKGGEAVGHIYRRFK